jgi:hypothetical protein
MMVRSRAMLLRSLLTAGLLGASVAAAAASAADAFVAGTEDLPLMPALRAVRDSAVVFDKPQGRIVEAKATGRTTRAAVEKFYASTLPELGWTAEGPNVWRRENERLRIDMGGRDGNLTVGFTILPNH